jgi:predicted Fe-S protein YdhL (DUF1289 family)
MKRLLLVALLALACSRTVIPRERWQSMPPAEKTLVVKTLIGAEKAKDAKGGNEKHFSRPPDEYVHRIDDAYAHGEKRDVNALFETMSD